MPAPSEESDIDIVDEADRPIGVMKRGLVREAGANFRVTHIFVIDDNNRILLQQLGQVRTLDPLLWGSSVAAHLYPGESYEAAARRRLWEELGIQAPVDFVCKIDMRERESLKFVSLFRTRANEATIREPDHSAAISFEDLYEVREAVVREPSKFTETFRNLLYAFSGERSQ